MFPSTKKVICDTHAQHIYSIDSEEKRGKTDYIGQTCSIGILYKIMKFYYTAKLKKLIQHVCILVIKNNYKVVLTRLAVCVPITMDVNMLYKFQWQLTTSGPHRAFILQQGSPSARNHVPV